MNATITSTLTTVTIVGNDQESNLDCKEVYMNKGDVMFEKMDTDIRVTTCMKSILFSYQANSNNAVVVASVNDINVTSLDDLYAKLKTAFL